MTSRFAYCSRIPIRPPPLPLILGSWFSRLSNLWQSFSFVFLNVRSKDESKRRLTREKCSSVRHCFKLWFIFLVWYKVRCHFFLSKCKVSFRMAWRYLLVILWARADLMGQRLRRKVGVIRHDLQRSRKSMWFLAEASLVLRRERVLNWQCVPAP